MSFDGRLERMISGLTEFASISKRGGLIVLVKVMACFQIVVLIPNASLVHLGALHIEDIAML